MRTRPTWAGHDIADFTADKPPDYQPPEDATGPEALSGTDPFIMQADGKAWLFAPAGLVDGLLPAHYEPQDSPFANLLYGQNRNPVRQVAAFRHPANRMQPSGDERAPACSRTSPPPTASPSITRPAG